MTPVLMRAAPPSEDTPLSLSPAEPVGLLVSALPDVVGPAVPAVERVPLAVAMMPSVPVPEAAPEIPVAKDEAPVTMGEELWSELEGLVEL